MKKIAVLLAFVLVSVAGLAQTKQELKEARKAAKAEQRRIRDSIFYAKDSIFWAEWEAKKGIKEIEQAKEGAIALLAKTPFESKKEILDLLVHSMITNGITPASIDKDYYIIRTGKRSAGSSAYETTYTIFLDNGKVSVRAASVSEGSVGSYFGYASNTRTIVVPLKYTGSADKGSAVEKAWREMEAFLLSIPHSDVQYIKEE